MYFFTVFLDASFKNDNVNKNERLFRICDRKTIAKKA